MNDDTASTLTGGRAEIAKSGFETEVALATERADPAENRVIAAPVFTVIDGKPGRSRSVGTAAP